MSARRSGVLAEPRVLPFEPVSSLADHEAAGGGRGLRAARQVEPQLLIDTITASGLRGRGGAGFPTGTKWQTVARFASSVVPATVVVNGAEGEPGTFKDRSILRTNPFAVLEGALIAARAVGADRVVIAVKETFEAERRRLADAVGECEAAGWCQGVNVGVATGPSEYLFGEETGLLEVLDGRPPFPRIAPPYRHGVDEVGFDPDEPAGTVMAVGDDAGAPPTLVNNVETLANVARIVADGPDWFRSVGTSESPGTLVCTITGATARHGVAEVPMGITLGEAIELIGEGPEEPDGRLVAAMSGVANALVPAQRFDTPLTYEDMRAAGSGLGAGGFIVFDDLTDFAAVAAGVARFLAVESCGQCSPCKRDGLVLSDLLAQVCRGQATDVELGTVVDRLGTVADNARCFLPTQQQQVLRSIIHLFGEHLVAHLDGRAKHVAPMLIAPVLDIVDGRAVLDERHALKQPDWTFGGIWSGQLPVERLAAGGPEDP